MSRKLCAFLIFALVCGLAFAAPPEKASPSPKPKVIDITAPREPALPPGLSLRLEKYTFMRRDRRDPFRPALTPLIEGQTPLPLDQTVFYSTDEQEEKFLQAQQIAQQIPQLSAAGDHTNVVRLYKELMAISPERFANEAYRNQVVRLQSLRHDAFEKSQIVIITTQAELILESMEKLLERNQYKKVLQHADEIEKFVLSIEEPGPSLGPQLGDLMRRSLEFRRRAVARQEFEEMSIVISGIAWSPDLRAAIINGKTYAPGDLVADELTILTIDENLVTFVFKGEQISKGLLAIGVK